MGIVNPLTIRGRGRAGFGSLTAGMVLRGSLPPQILVGVAAPPRPAAPDVLPARLPEPVEPKPEPVGAKPAPSVVESAAPEAQPEPQPQREPQPVPVRPAGRRRALTLRLDPVHHMRLRLVGSVLKRSAQDICVSALRRYLDSLPPDFPGSRCACLRAAATPDEETQDRSGQ